MPTVVEGDYEVFVFVKMTPSSIPVSQSVLWKQFKGFFFYITMSLFTGF